MSSLRHRCHPLSKLHQHSNISFILFVRQFPSRSISPTGAMYKGGHTPDTFKDGFFLEELIKLKTAAHMKDTLLPFPEFKK